MHFCRRYSHVRHGMFCFVIQVPLQTLSSDSRSRVPVCLRVLLVPKRVPEPYFGPSIPSSAVRPLLLVFVQVHLTSASCSERS